jgi:hypothetical protein
MIIWWKLPDPPPPGPGPSLYAFNVEGVIRLIDGNDALCKYCCFYYKSDSSCVASLILMRCFPKPNLVEMSPIRHTELTRIPTICGCRELGGSDRSEESHPRIKWNKQLASNASTFCISINIGKALEEYCKYSCCWSLCHYMCYFQMYT